MNDVLHFCFDIDGVLCTSTGVDGDYELAKPFYARIAVVNTLYEQGHHITLFTARGASTGDDWREFTRKQLASWGVKYHVLRTDKPYYDVFVDDKNVDVDEFFDQFLFAPIEGM